MSKEKGSLSIHSENIFPIIKKWLYSDHDIYIREVISNACDAITKVRKLNGMGEIDLPENEIFAIDVVYDDTAKTITSIRKFKSVLEEVRMAGYATNDREEYEHFVGISAPIFNYLSEPIAVLNIWSLHQRCSVKELSKWADELMASTSKVTELIGGKAPLLEYLRDR